MPPIHVYWRVLLLAIAVPICWARAADVFELKTLKYTPPSAHACRVVLGNIQLQCTNNSTGVTSPQCYASNLPFLSSLAVCLKRRVTGLTMEELENWWEKWAVGWSSNQPLPSSKLEEAISLAGSPTITLSKGMTLLNASLISDEDYESAYALVMDWDGTERFHEIFA
jgi:hypothetical protein